MKSHEMITISFNCEITSFQNTNHSLLYFIYLFKQVVLSLHEIQMFIYTLKQNRKKKYCAKLNVWIKSIFDAEMSTKIKSWTVFERRFTPNLIQIHKKTNRMNMAKIDVISKFLDKWRGRKTKITNIHILYIWTNTIDNFVHPNSFVYHSKTIATNLNYTNFFLLNLLHFSFR